jgi:DNA helicase HerA-like ATPase
VSFLLPPEIFHQHTAILGKTGSGKSSAMRLMAEHLLSQHLPVCIIDPKGDWWGLKLSADGKGPGFPVIIFGGEHADVPISRHSGASVAELVATGNRPCIIDLGGWMPDDRAHFAIEFASTLFRATKGKRFLFVDECHNFAPQGKVMDPNAGKMLHWFNRLASEGRGKGITIMAASQRPQKVHKDFLTCAETLICMRLIHVLDRNAAKDWMDGAGDKQASQQVLDTLAGMPRGEAWVWSPEIKFGPETHRVPNV